MGIGKSGIKSRGSGLAEVIGGLMGRQSDEAAGADRSLIQTQCNKWVFCSLHVPEADFRGEDS
jgi:hypothetical protein